MQGMDVWADEQDELWRHSRMGVLAVRELAELGIAPSTIAHRCRRGGPWRRLLPGVTLLAAATPNRAQMIRAALTYAGDGAVLTGIDALRTQGVRITLPGQVHLLIPHESQRSCAGFVLTERTCRLPVAPVRDGVPVAPATRAVLDAVRRMRKIEEVCGALAEVVQRSLSTPERLLAELDAGSGRGSALPREVLRDEIGANVHSVAEGDAYRVWQRSNLPAPYWNVSLFNAHGRFLGRPDAWFDDVGMAWQIDSYQWHLSPEAYAATVDRDAVMTGEGVWVLRTLPAKLRRKPGQALQTLEKNYGQAAARPRPDVYMRRAS